jgi:hypothetical protein
MAAMTDIEKSDYKTARDTACQEDGCKAKAGEWCGNPVNYFVHATRLRKSAAVRADALAVEMARLTGIAAGRTPLNQSWRIAN